jgi:serine/threonine-protein kinase HipA
VSAELLIALLGSDKVGEVRLARGGRLCFTYEDAWRTRPGAVPLSLSMPLAAKEHGHGVIDAFLWGLLPDNAAVLRRWGARFQVSARNAYALIAHVGEDCAGAVRFVRPERLVEARTPPTGMEVEWLEEADVASRLRTLRADRAAWRTPADTGQFSLAGAQAKTALLCLDGRWGVPCGWTPTTHILKPRSDEFEGHVENEHLCLALARALGLPAAGSEVLWFEDQPATVVERYDRLPTASLAAAAVDAGDGERAATLTALATTQPILRVHQEDLCQALGLPPTTKYQAEGGPTPASVTDLLRSSSSRSLDDVCTFVDALAFNWLIGGTDGHAKNYSLLHAGAGRVRLAPLYDLGSALPYFGMEERGLKLAMKVGGEYRLPNIDGRRWRKLAEELALDADDTIARIAALAARLPGELESVVNDMRARGLTHPVLDRLVVGLSLRIEACRRRLGA